MWEKLNDFRSHATRTVALINTFKKNEARQVIGLEAEMEEAGFLGCAEICNVGRILMWTNPERVWLELRGCQRHRFSIVSRKGQGD